MSRNELTEYVQKWLTATISKYKEDASDDCITRWLYLDKHYNGNDLAIVCGWQDGFENEGTNWNKDGEWRLMMKFATQPSNSIMQEYNIDWGMPYDELTDEVDDTELPISDNISDIEWMLGAYDRYLER